MRLMSWWLSQLAIVSHSILIIFTRENSKWSVSENTVIYCCSLPHYSAKQKIHLQCMDHHSLSTLWWWRKEKWRLYMNVKRNSSKKKKKKSDTSSRLILDCWSLTISWNYIMEFYLKSLLKSTWEEEKQWLCIMKLQHQKISLEPKIAPMLHSAVSMIHPLEFPTVKM